jgi:hypothetical protein
MMVVLWVYSTVCWMVLQTAAKWVASMVFSTDKTLVEKLGISLVALKANQ